ncbi:MAG: hypothetical protein HFJ28_04535 [Clostridia bacterium]|jgi:hypothetical protein|nr:hypothetical protein [Clostridia bacterium]
MNNSNQMDMASLMSMLSKMDKNQLEQGLSKLNQMLSSEDKAKIMKEFQKGK